MAILNSLTTRLKGVSFNLVKRKIMKTRSHYVNYCDHLKKKKNSASEFTWAVDDKLLLRYLFKKVQHDSKSLRTLVIKEKLKKKIIPFLCLCPVRLAIMLNFSIRKVVYYTTLNEYK